MMGSPITVMATLNFPPVSDYTHLSSVIYALEEIIAEHFFRTSIQTTLLDAYEILPYALHPFGRRGERTNRRAHSHVSQ